MSSAVIDNKMSHDEYEDSNKANLNLNEGVAPIVQVTPQDNKRILRRTDLYILTCLVCVYFFQTADKTIIGITAVYGLKTDVGLVGNQYSNIGNIGYYAQLVCQPLAAFCLVKLPYRQIMPTIVICWGIALLGLAASHNYTQFMACRFLLGWFEAAVVPLFSVITIAFYRRSEQPLRVAMWYGTNGLANVICSPIIFGLAKIKNPKIHIYQIVYIFFGLLTVTFGVASYWWLSDSPAQARFLREEDRPKAVERLKANQQGIRSFKFDFSQVIEAFTEFKFWGFMIITIGLNMGASTSSVFGPIILQQIVGFTPDRSVLLNIPYGALQTIMILFGSWLAVRFHRKGPILFCFLLPTIAGTAILYALPKTKANQGPLLLGYYLFAFLYAGNPLILSWMGSNCAGQTKKATVYTAYNAASAIGNIIAPYLFQAKYASVGYKPALQGVFVVFAVCAGVCLLQIANIIRLQRRKEQARIAQGLPAKLTDYSMQNTFHEVDEDIHGEKGLEDLTDVKNPYFIYVA